MHAIRSGTCLRQALCGEEHICIRTSSAEHMAFGGSETLGVSSVAKDMHDMQKRAKKSTECILNTLCMLLVLMAAATVLRLGTPRLSFWCGVQQRRIQQQNLRKLVQISGHGGEIWDGTETMN